MAIPSYVIDQILDRVDLVEIVGKYVKLKKSGSSYSGCCPFHQEKTPSFHVYRDKHYYHCFGCQANGNAIRFLMQMEGRNFIDVMQELSKQTGIDLPQQESDKKHITYTRKTTTSASNMPVVKTPPTETIMPNISEVNATPFMPDETWSQFDPTTEENSEGNLYDLLESVTQFYQQQLAQNIKAQQYFKQRGLSDSTIQHWRLGYAPEAWQHLQYVFPKDVEGLKLLGLIRTSDNQRDFDLLRDRVIFPIRDYKGRVVGFGGRALNDEIKPKYINSPDSDIFHKNRLLYGLYEGNKQKAKESLMVEGYMDVIALHQNGIYSAVATLGTASNAEHLQQLFKRNSRISLAFDGDQAGQKAARRTLEIALPLLSDGRELQFFVLPPEHDPDSLIRQEGVEYFHQLWQKSPLLSDFLYSMISQQYNLDSPEGKNSVMSDLKYFTQLLPQYSSFKPILTQFFKEKLGLTWKRNVFKTPDVQLSYQMTYRMEEQVIALLIRYPTLYVHFETLREIIPSHELLANILDIFHAVYHTLPNEQPDQTYYLLGACSAYAHEINQIMQRMPEQAYESAENIDRLTQNFMLHLQRKYLNEKMKHCKSVQETLYIRQILKEIHQKITFHLK